MSEKVAGRDGLEDHVVPDWDRMHDALNAAPFDPSPTRAEWLGLMGVVETAHAAYSDWASGHREDGSFLALGNALGMCNAEGEPISRPDKEREPPKITLWTTSEYSVGCHVQSPEGTTAQEAIAWAERLHRSLGEEIAEAKQWHRGPFTSVRVPLPTQDTPDDQR